MPRRSSICATADAAHRCGAAALAEQARAELVLAGARPRRDAARGSDALTASELRVARMAADGLTNREIAQDLFVSVRTVETHLTHVYRKLSIDSRDDLGYSTPSEPSIGAAAGDDQALSATPIPATAITSAMLDRMIGRVWLSSSPVSTTVGWPARRRRLRLGRLGGIARVRERRSVYVWAWAAAPCRQGKRDRAHWGRESELKAPRPAPFLSHGAHQMGPLKGRGTIGGSPTSPVLGYQQAIRLGLT